MNTHLDMGSLEATVDKISDFTGRFSIPSVSQLSGGTVQRSDGVQA
jgi:hypothetical protein